MIEGYIILLLLISLSHCTTGDNPGLKWAEAPFKEGLLPILRESDKELLHICFCIHTGDKILRSQEQRTCERDSRLQKWFTGNLWTAVLVVRWHPSSAQLRWRCVKGASEVWSNNHMWSIALHHTLTVLLISSFLGPWCCSNSVAWLSWSEVFIL